MPVSGTWRVTYSLQSMVYGNNQNVAYLHLNGVKVPESVHSTYSGPGELERWSGAQVVSTGGREVTREVSTGDTFELRTEVLDGHYYRINFCAEYIPTI